MITASLPKLVGGTTRVEDPLPGYNFYVTLDPTDPYLPPEHLLMIPFVAAGAFTEVKGLGSELEILAHPEGGNNDYVHQLPVRHTWGRITFRRGVVRDMALWLWYSGSLNRSRAVRRDGAIVLTDEAGEPSMIWQFQGAIATKWTGPDLNASQSQVAIDGLEIAHQGLITVPLPTTRLLRDVAERTANAAGNLSGSLRGVLG